VSDYQFHGLSFVAKYCIWEVSCFLLSKYISQLETIQNRRDSDPKYGYFRAAPADFVQK
jgi:hypothetical protein